MEPQTFSVRQSYATDGEPFFTHSIAEAVLHAAAYAMHTGESFAVRIDSETLITFGPSTIDWRRVNAAHMLRVKALAHDLVPAVNLIAPNTRKEGLTEPEDP